MPRCPGDFSQGLTNDEICKYIPPSDSTFDEIHKLVTYYNSYRGRFIRWWQGASEYVTLTESIEAVFGEGAYRWYRLKRQEQTREAYERKADLHSDLWFSHLKSKFKGQSV